MNSRVEYEQKSCYIISETSLGLQCAEIFINSGHVVLGIISQDIHLIKWAIKHNIPYYSSISNFEKIDTYKKFDYLFSIVNSQILSNNLLLLPRRIAVNYHDSLLPKYAGIHATSWALLNKESRHGVTWHILDSTIDTGNILVQKKFNIDIDDTVLSLNLKCYNYAIETFKELLELLKFKSDKSYSQDLKKRTYFAPYEKPRNCGLISWDMSAQEILALNRALSFGNYPNLLATCKLYVNNSFIIPNKITVLKHKSQYAPGTIIETTDQAVEITTITDNISLTKFVDLRGNTIKLGKQPTFYVGCRLLDFKFKNDLIYQYNMLAPYEKYWIKELKKINPNMGLSGFNRKVLTKNKILQRKTIPQDLVTLIATFPNYCISDIILTAFLVYLSNVSGDNCVTINLNDSLKINQNLHGIISHNTPFNVVLVKDKSIVDVVKYIINKRSTHKKNKTFAIDLLQRIPELKNVNTNLDVIVNIAETQQEIITAYNFPLSLNICVKENLLFLETIEEFSMAVAVDIIVLIAEFILKYDGKIFDIPLLTQQEYNQAVIYWNQTERAYPDNKTIHQLFEEQVERTPDSIALVYEDIKLSYQMLNTKANQLANYLISTENIKPDTLITLCLERSEHMLIAILGVLKAGAAYVPIDPSYPDDRIRYIIKDTETKIILTNEIYAPRLQQITPVKLLVIGNFKTQKLLDKQSSKNPNTSTTSNNLAYVMYTSGTSGKPKGVMIAHAGYSATINSLKNLYFKYNNQIKTYSITNYTFDIFGLEYGLPIINGGTITIGNSGFNTLNCLNYDFVQMTPSVCELKLEALQNTSKIILMIGGEALNKDLLNNILNKNINIINVYGPTETTIWSSSKEYVCMHNHAISHVSIGKPLHNNKIYILSPNLVLLPIGAIGELYLGGAGLARGYLNQPGLTAERFIANPFQTSEEILQNKNSRIYKTGDLVRYLQDGNLEYIGRNDFQVKIRGFRIELGEIENVLSSYEGVKQSVVLAKESNNANKYLVGYYVADAKLNVEVIQEYLQSKLPEYMVPTALVQIASLPLTVNGKLDRKALPEPMSYLSSNYIAPRNELEHKVCKIWMEVLGLSATQISINDDFFKLGGNSILAIKLLNQINRTFDCTVSVSAIFKYSSIEKLTNYIMHGIKKAITIEPCNIVTPKEQLLSFAQERLWFINKYEEGTNAYNIPIILKLNNNAIIDQLKTSLQNIVNRHEILRTLIKEDNKGNAYQITLNDLLTFNEMTVNTQVELEEQLKLASNHVYDLSIEYPIKATFYKLFNEYYVSIIIHHIAFDGWSTQIFFKELNNYLNYYVNNTPLSLMPLSIQYKDFALWQRKYLKEKLLEKQLSYWQHKLTGYETLNIITDYPRPMELDYSGAELYFELDAISSTSLRELAKELNVSLYTVLLSGYYLLLRSYSNQDDLVIGTPIANRHYTQIEGLIGFFVNTLALRIIINSDNSIKEFIEKVGKEVINAQLHQDLPFEKLAEELKVPKDTSRHPIFQVMFGMDNFAISRRDLNNQLQFYNSTTNIYNIAKFDISTFINDDEPCLKGSFNYAVTLYKETTIKSFIKTYIQILKQLPKAFHIHDLNYLCKESQQLLNSWNQTERAYPDNKTIHQLFEEQVERTPDSIALVYEDIKLSYQMLNTKANQLANYLISTENIKPDTLITLCLERSEHMLIAILGVLKAGAAYVPIDPSYPDDRINYIITDTGTKIILTNEIYAPRLQQITPVKLLVIGNFKTQKLLDKQSSKNPNASTTSNNLAYVIYTSGTTGNPKGVMVGHRGVINLKYDLTIKYGFHDTEVILQFSNYVFDVSIEQMVLSLLGGHILLIIPNNLWSDKDKFYNYLELYKVTHLNSTPSVLQEYNFNKITTLKRFILGGEPLSINNYNKISLNNTKKIINVYGPAEASITSIINVIRDNNLAIGTPISNVKCYVLSPNLVLLPIGAIGELYLGGAGLARGYLNQPGLTAERFIANPFQTSEEILQNKNSRIYKTGDLVRYLQDGNLEYIGRNDFQVKIRGFRIELGEIENVLSSYEGVKQSVVLAKESNNANKYLVGYYVADAKLNVEVIQEYLQSKLPEYMVPTALVQIASLPLTVNGKLDRKALPEPMSYLSSNYIAPRNELEHKVCKIWMEVLGLSATQISINDDFFKLGGDSIVSIQLVSRLRQQLNLKVSVKEIFQHKTILRLFDNVWHIKDNDSDLAIKAEKGILSGEVPLLPIQEWFFANDFKIPQHWNQSFIVKVPQLDIGLLEQSINKLIAYHDNLRLRYQHPIKQYYDDTYKTGVLKVLNITAVKFKEGTKRFNIELQKTLTNWQNNFNLEQGQLYSIGYLYGYKDGSARLHFALHHLIVDVVSWRILTKDLQTLYEGRALGPKGSSYRQWTQAIKAYALIRADEKEYWLKILADYNPNILTKTNHTNYTNFHLTPEVTKLLLTDSNKTYHTQINDLLLAALNYALSIVTDNNINHIVLEGHGREEIDKTIDVTNTVGWFTTMYPVRLELKAGIKDNIIAVKEALRGIPNKGIGYGAIIGYSNDLPKISFNYLGQFESSDNTFWTIHNEASGLSVNEANEPVNIIDINGLVMNNKLTLNIATQLNQDIAVKLTNIFKAKLEEIIHYTASQQRSYLTVSDIDYVITQACLDKLQSSREINNIYLANSLQEGFIYHFLNQGDIDDAYRLQLIWEYHNKLDIDKLKTAWFLAKQRFSSLRLRFNWNEKLIQIIDKEGNLDWRFIDLSKESDSEAEYKINQIQVQDRLEPYNLKHGNLFRVYLIRQQEELYTCIFSNHHAILDGWSSQILIKYIHESYLQLLNKKSISLSLDHTYEEAQQYLQAHRYDNQAYWEQYVSQIEERPDLSNLLSTPIRLNEYKHIKDPQEEILLINEQLYYKLKQICQTEGITLNAILQYAWHKSLSVYGNSRQTVVGTTISGRNIPVNNIESSVGLYINTLPLIVNHKNQTMITTIKDIQAAITELNTRSEINLSQLQKQGERLFDSLFIYENYPVLVSAASFLKIIFTKSIEKLDYPLGVIAYETTNQLLFKIQYAAEIFRKTRIQDLLLTINKLLEQIATNHHQSTCNLNYLTPHEQQLLNSWNQTERTYPDNKTIHQLFEEQVERTPDSIALVYEDIKISYQMLNTKANQLANYLISTENIKPDTLITLCLERSEHMLIAILGVLKAGAAYVPIDPSYPDDRIRYIIKDTETKIILTNEIYAPRLQQITPVKLLVIGNFKTQKLLDKQSSKNPNASTTSNNLAYVIYTSGTTGKPKGVMIVHSGYSATINSLKNLYFKYNNQIKTYSITNYTFDIFGLEYGLPIINGGTITIGNSGFNTLNCLNYDFVQMTPSVCELKLEALQNTSKIILMIGGEALNKDLLNNILNKNINIINVYGPTETTIWSSSKEYVCMHNHAISHVSIGKPLHNNKIYILSPNLVPLPIGAIGELYLGGAVLALGYLNQPGLTAERFIANPFQTSEEILQNKNSRIYKTGDLVRHLQDGNLEYIGRNDFQVKIRGFRIELGEIENVLSSYEGVKQSVVLAKESNNANKYLVGYYVADAKLNVEVIQEYLQSKLPEYMVPTALVQIASLPLTVNGKLDRKALPEPMSYLSSNYIAPRNELEYKVCKIWMEVLGLSATQVSINDDFFKLGGNSIVSIQLASKLNQKLHLKLTVKDIFDYKTVGNLCDNVLKNNISSLRFKNECQYIPKEDELQKLINGQINASTICITANNNSNKLFMLPPLSGLSFPYIGLSKYIKKVSIFAIHDLDFGKTPTIGYTLTHLAIKLSLVIEQLLLNHNSNKDKISLAGWSFGGLLSIEVARILIEKNYNINKIILIDTLPPHALNYNIDNYDICAIRNMHPFLKTYNIKEDSQTEKLIINNLKKNYNLIKGHKIKKINHDVTLLQIYKYKFDTFWAKKVKQLQVIPIFGNHLELFDSGNISSLAKYLELILAPPTFVSVN